MGYLVAAYAVAWVGLFAYLGWIALRLRGARAELAAIEDLVRERGGASSTGSLPATDGEPLGR